MKIRPHFHNSVVRFMISLALALAALETGTSAPRAARAAGPYVVDTATDGVDTGEDGACISTGGGCSLRAAIEEAFDDGPTTITFAASLNGIPQVLSDSLGTINWAGSNITVTGGVYGIIVSGEFFSPGKNLIQISGDNNVLQNIYLKDASANGVEVGDLAGTGTGNDNLIQSIVVTGNGSAGVYVRGGSGGGGLRNRVMGSLIGLTDPYALGCAGGEGNRVGVLVAISAVGTQVTGNLIGCSAQDGISIDGTGGPPADTLVYGNKVGVNLAPAAIPNGWAGVAVVAGARRTTVDQNVISGNVQEGMYVAVAATGQITVTSNNIGTNSTGLALGNGLDGILVTGAISSAMTIDNNTISGNGGSGISIANSRGVAVTFNRIGTDPLGLTAAPNAGDGVKLSAGASQNLIGGTQAAGLNVISGNLGSGVLIDGAATTLNQVSGNYIGTNLAGTAAIPNQGSGVRFDNSAHHNLLGSLSLTTQRNVISGNAGDGVYFVRLAHDNSVDGNFIGLNAAGSGAIGNRVAGVAIIQSPSNVIGSASAVTGQYIAGNGYQGIYVSESMGTYMGATNVIGASYNPNSPLGNGWQGIWLNGASNTRVEVLAVAYNGRAGVAVSGSPAAGNKIFFYENYGNGGLPIDLNNDGATANDPADADTGPNTLLNYPVITALAGTTVTGTACANCAVYVYKAVGNPAAPGGGGVLLNSTLADGGGDWSLSGLPAGLTRFDLSATACDTVCGGVAGNTSEMSPRWHLSLPIVLR